MQIKKRNRTSFRKSYRKAHSRRRNTRHKPRRGGNYEEARVVPLNARWIHVSVFDNDNPNTTRLFDAEIAMNADGADVTDFIILHPYNRYRNQILNGTYRILTLEDDNYVIVNNALMPAARRNQAYENTEEEEDRYRMLDNLRNELLM